MHNIRKNYVLIAHTKEHNKHMTQILVGSNVNREWLTYVWLCHIHSHIIFMHIYV